MANEAEALGYLRASVAAYDAAADHLRQTAVEAVRSGLSERRVAEAVGIHRATLKKWLTAR